MCRESHCAARAMCCWLWLWLSALRCRLSNRLAVGRFVYLEEEGTLLEEHDMVEGIGLVIVLCCALSAILVLQNVAAEKDATILAFLRTVGLQESTYWSSWLLAYLWPCLLSALLSTAVGNIAQLRIYANASFAVHFINMFLFLQSCAAFA